MSKFKVVGLLFFICGLLNISYSFAANNDNSFTCQLTINKAKDWHKQNLIVNVVDFNTKQVITTFELPADKPKLNKNSVDTLTKSFNCGMHPDTQLIAHYYPAIWSTEKGKTYPSRGVYKLGDEIAQAKKNKAKDLEITVDFPNDFLNVPDQINL